MKRMEENRENILPSSDNKGGGIYFCRDKNMNLLEISNTRFNERLIKSSLNKIFRFLNIPSEKNLRSG